MQEINNEIKFHQEMIMLLTKQRYAMDSSNGVDKKNLREKLKRLKNKKQIPKRSSRVHIDNIFEDDLIDRKIDARKTIKDNDDDINRIRTREMELIKSGVSPLDAKEQTRKELYPQSIKSKDSRNHELLAIKDSSDEENNIEEITNNLFHTPSIIQKLEHLGVIETENNYDNEDIIDEVVIYDE